MELSDLQLLEAIKSGQMEYFAQIYDRYSKQIYKYILNRVSNKNIAEDILSDTFFKALKNINNVNAQYGTLAPWLYKIASNTIIDYYKTKKITVDLDNISQKASDDDTSQEAKQKEIQKQVQEMLKSLNDKQREIVIMRLWDDLSYKEIMEITGIKEGNCKVIFSRAISTLKSSYGLELLLIFLTFNIWIK